MSLKSPPEQLILTPTNITNFPREIHLNILTFLRATDLSSLQRTSRTFNNRILIGEVVNHRAALESAVLSNIKVEELGV